VNRQKGWITTFSKCLRF